MNIQDLLERKIKAEFIPEVDTTGLNNFDSEITNQNPGESVVDHDK